MVAAHVAMAEDLRGKQDYALALQAAAAAYDVASEFQGGAELAALLLRLRSTIELCADRPVDALRSFNEARQQLNSQPTPSTESISDLLQLLQLLRRAKSVISDTADAEIDKDSSEEGRMRQEMAKRQVAVLSRQADKLQQSLLAGGKWVHPQQLPVSFVPGLTSRPWHSVADQWPALQSVSDVVRAAAPHLVEEVRLLRTRGLLEPEAECIHSSSSGRNGKQSWQTYMVNAIWHREKDAEGCSVHTPAACALLRAAAAAGPPGFRVLRGGYSVIEAATHLHPHCGLSNAQLKFHLGLEIPYDAAGNPCAVLRVGNETRAWKEQEILFFDDSFEHEVWNRCNATRSVFQLVFEHPELSDTDSPFPAHVKPSAQRVTH